MNRQAYLAGLAALLALTAGACKHTPEDPEPIIRTVYVDVPVDDPACVREAQEELGPAPDYPDTDEALRSAANLLERVKLLMAGRILRQAREAAITDAYGECGS